MMFMSRTSLITSFKLFSIFSVCLMMGIFFGVLFAADRVEKPILNKVTPKNYNENEVKCNYNMKNLYIDIEISNGDSKSPSSENRKEENCVQTYIMYYVYAVILGAYINIKRLYKMGPI